jgi:hypothetical protein
MFSRMSYDGNEEIEVIGVFFPSQSGILFYFILFYFILFLFNPLLASLATSIHNIHTTQIQKAILSFIYLYITKFRMPNTLLTTSKLIPGTKVQVGQYVVQVDKFLSEGELLSLQSGRRQHSSIIII